MQRKLDVRTAGACPGAANASSAPSPCSSFGPALPQSQNDSLLDCCAPRAAPPDHRINDRSWSPCDAGFRRPGDDRFTNDIDFAGVRAVAGWLAPNPGGTGPMMVLAVMQGVIDGARYQLGLVPAQ
ncbi:MAG TPA: hypothetical protein VKV28_06605 [Candidatus Binataceae bacterium]|nr:hypothetical protein [Candidatus Binataceae bacterium]